MTEEQKTLRITVPRNKSIPTLGGAFDVLTSHCQFQPLPPHNKESLSTPGFFALCTFALTHTATPRTWAVFSLSPQAISHHNNCLESFEQSHPHTVHWIGPIRAEAWFTAKKTARLLRISVPDSTLFNLWEFLGPPHLDPPKGGGNIARMLLPCARPGSVRTADGFTQVWMPLS